MQKIILFSVIIGIGVIVTGCSEGFNNKLGNTMGLNQKAPDEFNVIGYPPLSVPPTLRSQTINEDDVAQIDRPSQEIKNTNKKNRQKNMPTTYKPSSPRNQSVQELLTNN